MIADDYIERKKRWLPNRGCLSVFFELETGKNLPLQARALPHIWFAELCTVFVIPCVHSYHLFFYVTFMCFLHRVYSTFFKVLHTKKNTVSLRLRRGFENYCLSLYVLLEHRVFTLHCELPNRRLCFTAKGKLGVIITMRW